MAKYTLYIHPTCYSSYLLVKGASKYIGNIDVKVAVDTPVEHMRLGLFSVPMMYSGGTPILADPIEPDDVKALMEGNLGDIGIDDALEHAVNGIMASQFLLVNVLLHGSITRVVDMETLKVISRLRFHGAEHMAGALAERIARNEADILRDYMDTFVKVLALGIAREVYWLGVDPGEVDRTHIAMFLMDKASIGRVSLPFKPEMPKIVDIVYETFSERKYAYLNKVKAEQDTIYNDAEYMELLRSLTGPRTA